MSDMRLKFALTNGGAVSCDATDEELNQIRDLMKDGGSIELPGNCVINARHIVVIETEAINHV